MTNLIYYIDLPLIPRYTVGEGLTKLAMQAGSDLPHHVNICSLGDMHRVVDEAGAQ